MALTISISVASIFLLLSLPAELFQRNRPMRNILKLSQEAISHRKEYENKLLISFLRFSKYIKRLSPYQVSVENTEKLRKNLVYAGLTGKITLEDLVAIKYGSAFSCLFFFLIFWIINPTKLIFFLSFLTGLLGYFLPDNWLAIKAKTRQWQIQKDLPGLLSSLAIVTDAGLNLFQGIEEVTMTYDSELSAELKKTLDDIRIGISQTEAFTRLADRNDVEELSLFVSALTQGLEKGSGGITALIRDQAKESWSKRTQRAKELAEKASIKLFMPLLLLVFPAFMIFLLGPMVFSIIELLRQ